MFVGMSYAVANLHRSKKTAHGAPRLKGPPKFIKNNENSCRRTIVQRNAFNKIIDIVWEWGGWGPGGVTDSQLLGASQYLNLALVLRSVPVRRPLFTGLLVALIVYVCAFLKRRRPTSLRVQYKHRPIEIYVVWVVVDVITLD